MSEFSIELAENLVRMAQFIREDGAGSEEANRAALYASLLSIEISLKACLESAGFSIQAIKAKSHRLAELLNELGNCEVQKEVLPGTKEFVPATFIRSRTVELNGAQITLGKILIAEADGASVYPNSVRYGHQLRHYPAQVVLEAAKEVLSFANDCRGTIRRRK